MSTNRSTIAVFYTDRQTAFTRMTVPNPYKKKTSQFDIFKHLIRKQHQAYSAYSVCEITGKQSAIDFFPRTVSQTNRTRIIWLGNLCQCGFVRVQIIIILLRRHA